MYPLILGLTSLDVFPVRNARANTFGSTIGVGHRPCQYLEPDFYAKLQLLSVRYIRVSFPTNWELPLTNYGKRPWGNWAE